MILPSLPNRFFIPDRVNNVHTWAGVGQAVAFAFEDVLVADCVEVGEEWRVKSEGWKVKSEEWRVKSEEWKVKSLFKD